MRAKAARILRIVSHERSPDRTRIKFQPENVSIEGRIEVPVRRKRRSPTRYLSALHGTRPIDVSIALGLKFWFAHRRIQGRTFCQCQ